MKESIKMMIDRFKVITTRVQQMILRLNRLVFSIGEFSARFFFALELKHMPNYFIIDLT